MRGSRVAADRWKQFSRALVSELTYLDTGDYGDRLPFNGWLFSKNYGQSTSKKVLSGKMFSVELGASLPIGAVNVNRRAKKISYPLGANDLPSLLRCLLSERDSEPKSPTLLTHSSGNARPGRSEKMAPSVLPTTRTSPLSQIPVGVSWVVGLTETDAWPQ